VRQEGVYISEIFSAIQGEGLYIGQRQIFLRLLGCDLRCGWCDTPDSLSITSDSSAEIESSAGSRIFTQLKNPLSLEQIIQAISQLEEEYLHHSLSLTGGEPLLQSVNLKSLLSQIREKHSDLQIHLETGGHRYQELEKIARYLNYVSMDFKLPSSTLDRPLWQEHQKFLEATQKARLEVVVKLIITSQTEITEVLEACQLLRSYHIHSVILQPVTRIGEFEALPASDMLSLQQQAIKVLGRGMIRVIPQTHKYIGQK